MSKREWWVTFSRGGCLGQAIWKCKHLKFGRLWNQSKPGRSLWVFFFWWPFFVWRDSNQCRCPWLGLVCVKCWFLILQKECARETDAISSWSHSLSPVCPIIWNIYSPVIVWRCFPSDPCHTCFLFAYTQSTTFIKPEGESKTLMCVAKIIKCS